MYKPSALAKLTQHAFLHLTGLWKVLYCFHFIFKLSYGLSARFPSYIWIQGRLLIWKESKIFDAVR